MKMLICLYSLYDIKNKMIVYVLSANTLKISVARELFEGDIRSIAIHNVMSHLGLPTLPPQPINEFGPMCALARIAYFKTFMKNENKSLTNCIIVSIENFIETESCQDKCCVAIEYNGKSICGISDDETVMFPKKYLAELGPEINYDGMLGHANTIGECVHKDDPTYSKNDWMSKFNIFVTRRLQIENAYNNINFKIFLTGFIKYVPNFSKGGMICPNIFPLLQDPYLGQLLYSQIIDKLKDLEIDYVVGLDAPGFIFGSVIADRLGVGFVPMTKVHEKNLSPDALNIEIDSPNCLEIERHCIPSNSTILIVDDILTTGDMLLCANSLIRWFEPTNVFTFVLSKINELTGEAKISLGEEVYDKLIILFD